MVQVSYARGWNFDVDRGPDWLFVRPRRHGPHPGDTPLWAEQIWALLEQNFTYRLVLELDEVEYLDSCLVGQLVWLHKRIGANDGVLRICGLNEFNQDILHLCGLEGRFGLFRNREEAVMRYARPLQPR